MKIKRIGLILVLLLYMSVITHADMTGTKCKLDKPLRIFAPFVLYDVTNYRGADVNRLYVELDEKKHSFILPAMTEILIGKRHDSFPDFIWVDIIDWSNKTIKLPKNGYVYFKELEILCGSGE